MKKVILIFYLLAIAATSLISQQDNFPKLAGSYLGQKVPGMTPEVFAKSVTPQDYDNGGFTFSPKGDEVCFFSVSKNGKFLLHYSKISNGYWTKPEQIFYSNSANYVHPFFSTDGKKIFFGSNKQIKKNEKVPYFNIWASEKINDNWSELKPLPSAINTGYENCGTFSKENKLFFRRVSPTTRGDIFQSDYINGKFKKPIKLPDEVNTIYDESHPAISPDESYLIFSSKRPVGFSKGKDELWISFNLGSNKWSKAVSMGKTINTGSNTSCATISPDGKYIFFIRIEYGKGIPYWVSAKITDEIKQTLMRKK